MNTSARFFCALLLSSAPGTLLAAGSPKVPAFPAQWPDLQAGKLAYERTCALCHGPTGRGDGPSREGLDPPPTDFHDPKMEDIAPLEAHHTIRNGAPGTGMTAFPTFTEQETWDLAFHILSLRHAERTGKTFDRVLSFYRAQRDLGLPTGELLEFLAAHSDREIRQELKGPPDERTEKLAGLRLRSRTAPNRASLELSRFSLEESLEHYAAGRKGEANRSILRATLEGIGPIEPRLGILDPGSVKRLELALAALRNSIARDEPLEKIRPLLTSALQALQMAFIALLEQEPSHGFTFTLVLGTILRAGWPALLLVAVLLGVLRATGQRRGTRSVHGGWSAAVGAGMLVWFLGGRLPGFDGMGRAILEGWVGALTAVIFLYMGFRLHQEAKVGDGKSMAGRDRWMLVLAPFLGAFQELPNTVLFLRGIGAEGGKGWELPLGAGVAATFAFFVLFVWAAVPLIANLPPRRMFAAVPVALTVPTLVLGGKAAHAFQEAGLFPATPSFLDVRWDWLGLYPTLEAQTVQAAFLALGLSLWFLGKRVDKA